MLNCFPPLGSMPIYVHPEWVLREQVRFPRSRKVRIRRKWAKQKKNWRKWPDPKILQIGNAFHMHPFTLEILKIEIDRQNSRAERFSVGFS